MKTDYPELEGTPVTYVNSSGTIFRDCVVIGCNYNIGVTIMDDEKRKYVYCLLGTSAPNYPNEGNKMRTRRRFHKTVKGIKKGWLDIEDVVGEDAVKHESLGGVTSSFCPFGQ